MDLTSPHANFGGMGMPPIPTSPLWSPRISPETYVALQFFAMALAIITSTARTYLRVRKFRRLTLDDYLLLLAVCFEIVSVAVSYQATSMIYWTTYVNLGLARPPPGWGDMLLSFSIADNVSNVFGWGAIFTVKISFLVFLRSLVTRVRLIHSWWWVVFIFVVLSTPLTMFLGFYVCPIFGKELMEQCAPTVVQHQIIFITVNCVVDIVSDCLILTIPCWLLWKVQISLRRKIALGTVLCLSIVMVTIAIIRVTLDHIQLPNGAQAPDTTWLYFWTNIETAVAVIMVSLTAFRSMLGQEGISRVDAYNTSGAGSTAKASRTSSQPGTLDRHRRGWLGSNAKSHIGTRSSIRRHTTHASVDSELTSIRKDVTIHTHYAPNFPAPAFTPHEGSRVSSEHRPSIAEKGTFLDDSSGEGLV